MPTKKQTCCHGPGFSSPLDAFKNGKREQLLYVTAIALDPGKPDALVTIDVDPNSKTYSTAIHELLMPNIGDELHHSGWNACSSCFNDTSKERRFLILPGVLSGRIYFIDTIEKRAPKIHKIIEGDEIERKTGLAYPHSVHCLGDGNVMISFMGDKYGNGKGGFVLFDQEFNILGNWSKDEPKMKYGYDFWYQPRHNIMVSSEWGTPSAFTKGFYPEDLETKYGKSLYFWNWKSRELLKSVDLGDDGMIPLEVRFLHNPDSPHGFVGSAYGSSIIHFWKENNDWKTETVVSNPPLKVENWAMDSMPSLITDILISLDDKYLYCSNWLHGDIRQYDITDPHHPKMVGQIFIGGSIGTESNVKVKDGENVKLPIIKGKKMDGRGGPQMLQLSLDGKRLYVTTSLFKSQDAQFYPKLVKEGATLLKIDVDTEKGGLSIDENFLVDFGKLKSGKYLAHEMRYPGGDCTSDIWI